MTDPILDARIFLVDDQPANLRLLERFLGRAGFHDLYAYDDPQLALAEMDRYPPDLVLLDLHMPGLDGFEILEALRRDLPDDDFLPIVVLTGDTERTARTRALASGATDYLIKPLDGEEVVLRSRNLIHARQLHQAVRIHNRSLRAEVAVASRALHDLTDQWAVVTAALARLAVLDTPEATAAAICAELDALPDLAGSAILAFGAGGSTMPLGIGSFVDDALVVNVPLRDEWSGVLRERAADGAWIQPLATPDLAPLVASATPTTIACVPLRDGGSLLGLLIASVHGPEGVSRLARRLPSLETFAAVASALLSRGILERQRDDAVWGQIDACVASQAFTAVFQPIVDLAVGTLVGYEALTRFSDGVPPDRRFADAAAVGLGLSLESATMTAALAGVSALPRGIFMSLNVSPEMLLDGRRVGTLIAATAAPVVLEITEHVPVEDYPELRDAIARLGPSVRFAVDDAGSGFASFRHILELRPDFLKLDIGLVRDIDRDPARQAFVAAMVYFAARTDCTLIAEGIETPAEQRMLRELGVALGQGYLMGTPGALPAGPADAYPEGSAQVA